MTKRPPTYHLCERIPTLAEYFAISSSVGWQEAVNYKAAAIALPNSIYSVTVEHKQQAIGMGRIVGDNAIFFYIQDIAVKPIHQGHGIGTVIMHCLLDYIGANAPDKAFIGLFAAPNTTRFYKQFGFLSNLGVTGMYQVHTR